MPLIDDARLSSSSPASGTRADRLWRSSEALDITIFSLTNAERGGLSDVAKIYEQRRQDSLASQHTAGTEALFLIAQMRLLYPQVAESAQAVWDASSSFDRSRRDELRATPGAALEAYESSTRELLTSW